MRCNLLQIIPPNQRRAQFRLKAPPLCVCVCRVLLLVRGICQAARRQSRVRSGPVESVYVVITGPGFTEMMHEKISNLCIVIAGWRVSEYV